MQWAVEIKNSITCALPAGQQAWLDPAWAQFWASVLGLAVAIAVPTVLHVRDRKDRLADKQLKARTYAVSVVTDVLMLRAVLDSAKKLHGDQTRELLDKVQIVTNLSPALHAAMPQLHEFGAAAAPMQSAFAAIKRLEQAAVIGDFEEKSQGIIEAETYKAMVKFINQSSERLASASAAIDVLLQ
ncbi:hypothetical protein N5C16_06020 [Stenotrophomonas sp. GD03908]|nr:MULTISPECIES: hypothetical protein [Stenotrophomonas]MBH1480882.1 hypothetical protein [Stenotrophomonas maltophilia]MDH0978808.1 hypothetical protein [Stenotrophomonas sp. GD03908]MDQ7294200.1 hypothetical protein [Stenotrophomonas sp. Sm0041]